jgi:hypothetical protein
MNEFFYNLKNSMIKLIQPLCSLISVTMAVIFWKSDEMIYFSLSIY